MIRNIVVDWVKQYLPILINAVCTAVCVALAGCKLTADNLSVQLDYPAKYTSSTNSPSH